MPGLKTKIKQLETGLLTYSSLIDAAELTVNLEGKWIIDKFRATEAELKESLESLRQCGCLSDELKEPVYLLD